MNFDLTDDQRLLRDSLTRLTAGPVTAQAAADLGLNMALFAEADGGLGLGPVEMMLIGEAFGRAMVSIPFLAGPVMAGTALRCAPCSADRSGAIDAMMADERRFAFVDDPSLVLGGDSADVFIVPDGNVIALIDATVVRRRSFMLHNGWGAAAVDLGSARRMALGELADSRVRVQQAAIGWLAAYATGVMAAAFDATVEHLGTRQQFGRPIGGNQALRHRVAEMLVELEAARSMAIYATQAVRDTDADERVRAFPRSSW